MAVNIDIVCSRCGAERYDVWSDEENTVHVTSIGDGDSCDGNWERLWTVSRGADPMCHPSEACVVYISEKEGGKVQYPGANNLPIPERLRQRGYEKVVMSPRQVIQFERTHGVINERLNYDRNGRGAENQ